MEKLTSFMKDDFDIFVIICLAVVPDFIHCFSSLYMHPEATYLDGHIYLLTRSCQVTLPILLIMWLRNVQWSDYGFAPWRSRRDFAVAIGLYLLSSTCVAFFVGLVQVATYRDPVVDEMVYGWQPPVWIGWFAVLAACIANGFAEELALRSYLLTRIKEATGSTLMAIGATTLMFASYHIYQGALGVFNCLVVGTIFGSYVVLTKRIWPVAISHMLMDLVPQLPF